MSRHLLTSGTIPHPSLARRALAKRPFSLHPGPGPLSRWDLAFLLLPLRADRCSESWRKTVLAAVTVPEGSRSLGLLSGTDWAAAAATRKLSGRGAGEEDRVDDDEMHAEGRARTGVPPGPRRPPRPLSTDSAILGMETNGLQVDKFISSVANFKLAPGRTL